MQCLRPNVIVHFAMFCRSHLWHDAMSETLNDGIIIDKEVEIPFGRRDRMSNTYDLYNEGDPESTEMFSTK